MDQMEASSPLSLTGNPADNWSSWEQSFRRYIAASGEKDEQVKIDILLHTIGEDALEVYNYTLTDRGELTMEDVLQAFKKYYNPQKNVVFERYQYWSHQMTAGTSVNTFITELRQRSQDCLFGISEHDMLRDKLVLSITDCHLKKRLFQERGLTLHRAIEICRETEQGKTLLQAITTEHGVQEVPVDAEMKMIVPENSLHHNTSRQLGSQSGPYTDKTQQLVLAAFMPKVQLHRLQRQQPSVTGCVFSERNNVEQLLPERLHIKEEPEMFSEGQEEKQLCVEQETNSAGCSVKCEDEEEKPQTSQLHWRQITEINIKEEPEMFSEGQEEKQLCVEQETNSAGCSVKCEDEEEKPQTSQLHWRQPTEITIKEEPTTCTLNDLMKRQTVGIHSKGPEAAQVPDPSSLVLQGLKTHSSQTEYIREDNFGFWQKPLSESETSSFKQICSKKKVPVKISNECVGVKKEPLSEASKLTILTGKKKSFECDVCRKCFTRNASLRIHKRIHTGEKPFECDVCSKCFNHKASLWSHMKIHSGDKPYKCDVCSKCFNHKASLWTHMKIHSGDKPYKCDVCSKCFIQKNHLQSHVRIHTGEKPFKCDVCSKCFNQKSSLWSHMRIHTGK